MGEQNIEHTRFYRLKLLKWRNNLRAADFRFTLSPPTLATFLTNVSSTTYVGQMFLFQLASTFKFAAETDVAVIMTPAASAEVSTGSQFHF